MPTYSNAIADATPDPQRPVATPPRRPRAKEFWEAEPGDPGTEGWTDNPEDPTGPQLGNPASPTPPPPVATPPKPAPNVVITNTTPKSTTSQSKYVEFVDQVTSAPSKDNAQFIARLATLQAEGCQINRLLTAAVGINAEGGEFMEIVKKIIFQGKPWDEANIEHLKIELGDVMWYVAQACMALDISLEEVLDRNIEKLSKRYPAGTFDSYYSENRRAGDL
jgi:NTP pyrophosphatase (non-canonical NTP hydrolase)